jgi:hypothetical protein
LPLSPGVAAASLRTAIRRRQPPSLHTPAMADASSSKAAARPPPTLAGVRKPGAGLLAGKPTGATSIPPSLQAKMAAMANRTQPPPAPPGMSPMAGRGPPGGPGGPGGLAARRTRPGGLHLSAIEGAIPASAGPAGGGLGAGRPMFDQPASRRPNVAETPFAALSNIVYVLSSRVFAVSFLFLLTRLFFLVTRPVLFASRKRR